jgi:hypothetical protein
MFDGGLIYIRQRLGNFAVFRPPIVLIGLYQRTRNFQILVNQVRRIRKWGRKKNRRKFGESAEPKKSAKAEIHGKVAFGEDTLNSKIVATCGSGNARGELSLRSGAVFAPGGRSGGVGRI